MDLKEFVTQTLCQIAEGTKAAQDVVHASGGAVNPHLNTGTEILSKAGFLWSSDGIATNVQFDVALTVTEGTGTKGGIGIFAGAVNLGSSGQSRAENTSISHVKFSVPLRLPKPKT
jgi:hypothetical protein